MAPPPHYPGLYYLWCQGRQELNRLPIINKDFGRTFEYKRYGYMYHTFVLAEEKKGNLGKFLAMALLQCHRPHPDSFGRMFTETEARKLFDRYRDKREAAAIYRDLRYCDPLHVFHEAAPWNDMSVVRFILVSKVVDVNRGNCLGQAALTVAAERGYLDTVRLLLSHEGIKSDVATPPDDPHDCSLDPRDYPGNPSPLIVAARNRHWEIVHLLVNRPEVDVDRLCGGRTPLSYAAEHGHKAVVSALLDTARVDVHYQDPSDRSPLLYAAEGANRDTIRLLLQATQKVSEQLLGSPHGFLYELIRLQMKNGKFLADAKDEHSRTFLSRAALKGDVAVVRLLLQEYPEAIDISNHEKRTPLSHAAKAGHAELVSLLITGKADINPKDKFLRTALSYAAEEGHIEVVSLLLGADGVEIAQEHGHIQAILYAVAGCHVEIVRLLLNTGRIDVAAGMTFRERDSRAYRRVTPLEPLGNYENRIGLTEKYAEIRRMLVEAEQRQQDENGHHMSQ